VILRLRARQKYTWKRVLGIGGTSKDSEDSYENWYNLKWQGELAILQSKALLKLLPRSALALYGTLVILCPLEVGCQLATYHQALWLISKSGLFDLMVALFYQDRRSVTSDLTKLAFKKVACFWAEARQDNCIPALFYRIGGLRARCLGPLVSKRDIAYPHTLCSITSWTPRTSAY